MRGFKHIVRPTGRRGAFSLAELMIAIGILGIGMLMVAATFPVGLDQSRIVSEQTVAPMVANDAFERLRLLLNEPLACKRIPNTLTAPTMWLYSFREALAQAPTDTILYQLPNGTAPFDPTITTTFVGLNEWLAAPYQTTSGTVLGGGQTRFYPSVAAQPVASGSLWKWSLPLRTNPNGDSILVDPPYTWSALYAVVSSNVRFFVFVNRRGGDWPSDWPQSVNFLDPAANAVILGPNNEQLWFSPAFFDLAQLNEGGFVLRADGNIIYRIKKLEFADAAYANSSATPDPQYPGRSHRITFDESMTPAVFWYVPTDATTGRSPCIAVYSRQFPLP